MKRRKFITGAAAAGVTAVAASSLPKPAISQGLREWRMVTSWPKGLPGLATGAQRVADRIGTMSDGRLTVKVFAGGELVPALQVFDGVAGGTAELGHDASYYHLGKTQALAFYTAVPYGLTANELNAWVHWGGGQELWDEVMAEFGLKSFLSGNTGVQMAGWFRKEINSVADLNGLKFRMPGLGGQVLQRLGSTVVVLPGAEIFPSLQSGAIDGTEWVGPYNDLSLGFHQVAKFYYWPGFHEPGSGLQLTVNKAEFDGLPADLKAIVEAAASAENDVMLAEFNARSGPSLAELVNTHGVQLRQMPNDVMTAIGTESGNLMQEIVDDGDAMTKKVATSYLQFRRQALNWTRISDQGYTNARLLPFDYPRG